MMPLIYVFTFLFGAIVGSFLNVCIYRMPRGESIVFPASHCPNCNRPLPWYCNIPFVSYIALGGRCKFCKCRINFRYFIVEAVMATVLSLLLWRVGIRPELLIYSVFFAVLIIISFIDIEHWIIPDELTIPGIIAGFVISGLYPALQLQGSRIVALRDSFLGIAFGFTSLYLLGVLGKMYFKKEAMGGGDVVLLMFIGAVLGWKLTVAAFFMSSVLGALGGLPKLLFRKGELIQYGPYLSLAAFIAVLFRDDILIIFPI